MSFHSTPRPLTVNNLERSNCRKTFILVIRAQNRGNYALSSDGLVIVASSQKGQLSYFRRRLSVSLCACVSVCLSPTFLDMLDSTILLLHTNLTPLESQKPFEYYGDWTLIFTFPHKGQSSYTPYKFGFIFHISRKL